MYSLKFATIFQIILFIAALAFSILYWIMAAIGRGMYPGEQNSFDFSTAYEYLWYFIAALLILKLVLTLVLKRFLLKENFVLPIGGLITFIVFVILNWANYKTSGSIGMSAYDFIYFPMLALLLSNSIIYLIMAIKALKT